jgi:hypothetical protein
VDLSVLRTTTEELLGPPERRYFGRGFQRVSHRITDIRIHPLLTDGTISATAAVDYPIDWSTKSDSHRARPHLSTVDVLIIGLQLTEAYLTHAHRLDPVARRGIWTRAVEMRAGATAHEQLAQVAAHGRRGPVRLAPASTRDVVSQFDFRIGSIRLSVEAEHNVGTPTVRPATWDEVEQLLGEADQRHYGRGYTTRRQHIDTITVDPASPLATGQARIEEDPVGDAVPREGMAAAYEPALSLVDATVCMAQLAQVLTYSLEGVDRGSTGTFWMRQYRMRFDTPTTSIAEPLTMTFRVARGQRLDRTGASWRLYDLDGDIGGNPVSTSIAFTVSDEKGATR